MVPPLRRRPGALTLPPLASLLDPSLGGVLHLLFLVGITVRLLFRRMPPGTTLAWIAVVALLPAVGAVLYLLLGEPRIGRRRLARLEAAAGEIRDWVERLRVRTALRYGDPEVAGASLARLGRTTTGLPAVGGNRATLLPDADAFFHAFLQDVRAAQRLVHAQFYIWSNGGVEEEVVAALLAARARGVRVRLLADAMGSKAWLRSASARRLREAGAEVVAALPTGWLRTLLRRQDLRDHRKLALVDFTSGYTGSQNLADPALFKRSSGVGRWVDVMVRVEGPILEELHGSFLVAWERETGRAREVLDLDGEPVAVPEAGQVWMQAIPTGPAPNPGIVEEMVISSMYAASRELVLTTPYFVPDAAMLTALRSAALRGTRTTLIVPRRLDSRLTQWASAAFFEDLLDAGVRVLQYEGGLLHAKTIAVDGEVSFVGSVNLDLRSLWLNFEITLVVYDRAFAEDLRALQDRYALASRPLVAAEWKARPRARRLLENAAQLVSPLL